MNNISSLSKVAYSETSISLKLDLTYSQAIYLILYAFDRRRWNFKKKYHVRGGDAPFAVNGE